MVASNRRHAGFGAHALFVFAFIPWFFIGCRKQDAAEKTLQTQPVAPPPVAASREVKVSPAILDEIVGRWRIVREISCGISMDQETTDLYMGKTALIEPGRMVFIDHKGHDCSCLFTDIRVSVRDTNKHLAEAQGCTLEDNKFIKIRERTVRVFEPDPDAPLWKCGGTPFPGMFKPNPETLVVQWNGVFFFMERDTMGIGQGKVQSPAPARVTKL